MRLLNCRGETARVERGPPQHPTRLPIATVGYNCPPHTADRDHGAACLRQDGGEGGYWKASGDSHPHTFTRSSCGSTTLPTRPVEWGEGVIVWWVWQGSLPVVAAVAQLLQRVTVRGSSPQFLQQTRESCRRLASEHGLRTLLQPTLDPRNASNCVQDGFDVGATRVGRS